MHCCQRAKYNVPARRGAKLLFHTAVLFVFKEDLIKACLNDPNKLVDSRCDSQLITQLLSTFSQVLNPLTGLTGLYFECFHFLLLYTSNQTKVYD